MKLYTINATPIRNSEQADGVTGETLDKLNNNALENYPAFVATILALHKIDGFTIYPVDGYWKGQAEKSYKIEIAVEDNEQANIHHICVRLRDAYKQDAVMLTSPDSTVTFI